MPNSSYIILLFCFLSNFTGFGQTNAKRLEGFIRATGAVVTNNDGRDGPIFLRFPNTLTGIYQGSNTDQTVQSFTSRYGPELGLADFDQNFRLLTSHTDQLGFEHKVYEQYFDGVPVFDGKLKWHFDPQRHLRTINGVILPSVKIRTVPSLGADAAERIAIATVKDQHQELTHSLNARQIQLFIFRKGLVRGIDLGTYLTYQVEVVNTDQSIREFIFVDAHSGDIVEQFTGTHSVLHRKVYQVSLSNLIWEEGDSQAGLNIWQKNEVEAAGHMYHLFKNTFGFISFDNADAPMLTIHQNPAINCPNANWNGTTANYCDQTASDDVVAHEWGHAYTDYTNNLIYAWQSGALNESYSDIWGETVDILNGYEDGGEDLGVRTGCNSSHRWLLGEDASAFGGALRDLWSPTCKGDPGKVSDPQYHCNSGDNGGVHSNSGVNNHAYALLVDGGTYNNQSINGLGFTKAAHIFWRAQREYLTATSNFKVQADALEAACSDLIGINLEGISLTETPAGPSGQVITMADFLELQKVLVAVEMRMDPPCAFSPLLAEEVLLCPGSLPDSAFYFEDFESGITNWTVSQLPTNPGTWEARDWEINTDLPDGRPGSGVFAPDPINGDCQTDLQNGILRLESPLIAIPPGITNPILLAFDHWVSTEQSWDGGNLKYKIDGGSWALLPAASFINNDYNLNLNISNNDNPLAGEPAFTGADAGQVVGSWGTSVIDLSSLGLSAGSTIRVRWELGTDGCNGAFGWYLDDVIVFSCADCQNTLNLASIRSDQQLLLESGVAINTTDTVQSNSAITYSAGNYVDFQSGFMIELGSTMEAKIEGCIPTLNRLVDPLVNDQKIILHLQEFLDLSKSSQIKNIDEIKFILYNSSGLIVNPVVTIDREKQSMQIDREHLKPGIYQCILNMDNIQSNFRFMVTE